MTKHGMAARYSRAAIPKGKLTSPRDAGCVPCVDHPHRQKRELPEARAPLVEEHRQHAMNTLS
jgi:hypothetical protein